MTTFSPPRIGTLTTSNLQNFTLHAQETPRTKIIRYFNQVEDPRILSNREPFPIPFQNSNNPRDLTTSFIYRDCPSPILGKKGFPTRNSVYEEPPIAHNTFDSEDSDILAHNPNIQNRLVNNSPKRTSVKRDYQAIQSVYSWSESPQPEHSKENIYEKRPRRKMVQDPVTGTTNANSKQVKLKKKATKISGPNMFMDLLPLDQFESKFIGKNRLSFDTNGRKVWGGVKDLEFPRLSELGMKKTVGDQESKRTQDSEEQVQDAKTQRKGEDDQPQISDYFERATKHDTNPVDVDEATRDIAVYRGDVVAPKIEVPANDTGTMTGYNRTPIPVDNMIAQSQGNNIHQIVRPSNSGQVGEDHRRVENAQNNEKPFEQPPGQPSYSLSPNIDLPAYHELTTDMNFPSASAAPVPLAPDPSLAILEQYTHLNSIIDSPHLKPESKDLAPKKPKPPDLDAIIDTCTAILARNSRNPVRVCIPLRPQSVQFTNPCYDNTQDVANHFTQSPSEILKDYWMHHANDGGESRYVSGQPFTKRSVWNEWKEGHEAMLMTTQYDASPDQYTVVLNYKPGYGILPTATMVEVPQGTVLISTGRQNRHEPGLGVFPTSMARLDSIESPRPLLLQHSELATAPGIEDSRDRLRAEIATMEREVEEEPELASNEDIDATEIEFDDNDIRNHGTGGEDDREDDQEDVTVPQDWWKNGPRRF